jgi:hypothetical protein
MILLAVVSPTGDVKKNLYINPLKRVTRVWEKEYR